MEDAMTLQEFIDKLNSLKPQVKDKPIYLQAKNGALLQPIIKLCWDDILDIYYKECDYLIITHKQ